MLGTLRLLFVAFEGVVWHSMIINSNLWHWRPLPFVMLFCLCFFFCEKPQGLLLGGLPSGDG